MGAISQAAKPLIRFNLCLKAFKQGIRLPLLVLSFLPALLGGLAAWAERSWSLGIFLLMVFAVWSLHAGANLWNDYHDELNGTDRLQINPSPYNGGSRVIQDGLLTVAQVRIASIAFLIFGGLLGLAACWLGSVKAIFFLVLGILAAWGYSAPPTRWAGNGWGEVVVGLSFGPFIAGSVYLTQTGRLSVGPIFASVVLGLLVATILCVNEIPDRTPDRLTNKYNWSVRMIPEAFERLIQRIIASAFILVIIGWLFRWLPRLSLLVVLAYPLARRVSQNVPKVKEGSLLANEDLIKLFLTVGSLLSLSFFAGRWTG